MKDEVSDGTKDALATLVRKVIVRTRDELSLLARDLHVDHARRGIPGGGAAALSTWSTWKTKLGDLETLLCDQVDAAFAAAGSKPTPAMVEEILGVVEPLVSSMGTSIEGELRALFGGGMPPRVSSYFDALKVRVRVELESRAKLNALHADAMTEKLVRVERPLVFTLHGIRTRGAFQKAIERSLDGEGFSHAPLDYGHFPLLRFLWPMARREQISWFRDQYTRETATTSSRPSVIAHSFGSYIVARSLELYPEISFDRVIFCGSIVRRDFPWSRLIQDTGQVQSVLNDYGSLDVPARLVDLLVKDAGPSGVSGFTDLADGRVFQRHHPEWSHSDAFYELNYRKVWVPFLKGRTPAQVPNLDPNRGKAMGTGIRLFTVVLMAVVALFFALNSMTRLYRGSSDAPVASRSSRSQDLASLLPVIERDLRTFMAATGFHRRVRADASLPERVSAISETWPLPETFRQAVRDFWQVSQDVSHGYSVPDADVERAVASGRLIQQTLTALVRERKVVLHTGVQLFSDAAATRPIHGIWGLVLQSANSDGSGTKSHQIVPTTRSDYQVGDEVTWDFDLGRVLGETWYADPVTKQVRQGWEESSSFVGKPLSSANARPR